MTQFIAPCTSWVFAGDGHAGGGTGREEGSKVEGNHRQGHLECRRPGEGWVEDETCFRALPPLHSM